MGVSYPTVVIVGATGAVGEDLRTLVAERELPVGEVRLVASARSAGRRLPVRGEEVEVLALAPEVFDGADLAFFSAGGGVSREWGPVAAERGAVVVDNSSAWRMHPDVPWSTPTSTRRRPPTTRSASWPTRTAPPWP